ncbi:beta-agarase [Rhodopirellula halodulae]|uniref:beta-agarase n=1 Tax=Rhodopirellula halodulae TaxID=2894198 RepID=UPI001E402B57|nr:beta-agarase [Rhodopirellula sp. JC737]MCC9658669.1 beta-agarase [Rhodopirellula sp. JC737]
MKRLAGLLLCLAFSPSHLNAQTSTAPAIVNAGLSEEGIARRDAHQYLFDSFVQDKQVRYRGEGDHRTIEEVVLSSEKHELSGEIAIELPKGSSRVASLFKYIILRGENLTSLGGIDVAPYTGGGTVERSAQEPELYRVKLPAMPVPSDDMPAMVIRTTCADGQTAVVTEVAFNASGRLPNTFDEIPYRTLGADQPRLPVSVKVDLQNELSIAGHIDLEREKFFRYYAAPGTSDKSFEQWAASKNFRPGRQISKLHPGLVIGYGPGEKLKENPNRKGAADLSFFERNDSSPSKTIEAFEDIDYAMCLNDYPEFMSVEHVGRGTPLVEHFGDAAELAASYIADQLHDGGRTAAWWEVKNESTIKAEWDYHWKKEYDSWKLLADFHNQVAQAVHQKTPDVKVGGPTSAWMQLHVNDFSLYRDQARFMDLTNEDLDFYSHHFYEDTGTLGAWERRKTGYSGYLLGRLEATLDMLRSHMESTNNVKPMLITECGSLQPGRGAADHWLRLRSFSAFTHKFMNRPHQLDLSVPFIFTNMHWNPFSGNAAFVPGEGASNRGPLDDFVATPVSNYFELWKDFGGRRLPVRVDGIASVGMDATAVYTGNRLQIALTNMTSRQLAVKLSDLIGEPLGGQTVTQRRLRYDNGHVVYEEALPRSATATIPIDAEETTVLTVDFAADVQPTGTRQRNFIFATGTAVALDEPKTFDLTLADRPKITMATLVIGVHRNDGLREPLVGSWNGRPIRVQPDWSAEFRQMMAPLEIPIDPAQLQDQNELQLETHEGLTVTSVQLRVETLQAKSPEHASAN